MSWTELVETAASAWAAAWPQALVKGAVLLGLTEVICRLLQRAPAAVRHLAWTVALAGTLVLPLLSATGLRLPVPLPAWSSTEESSSPARAPLAVPAVVAADGSTPSIPAGMKATSPVGATVQVGTPGSEARTPFVGATWQLQAPAAEATSSWRPSGAALAFLAWLAGALLALGAIGLSLARVRLLALGARPLEHARVAGRTRQLATRVGIRRPVRVLAAPGAMPMTWGLLHPAVLLPTEAVSWSEARLDAVLLHELAHVRRGDVLTQLLGEVAVALCWPNPLAWWGARRLRQEREHACDDVVLSHGSRASDYAAQLLDVARSLRASRAASLAAMAMARPSQLKGRLTALLDGARSHAAATPGQRALSVALGLVVLLPLAALAPRQAPAQDQASGARVGGGDGKGEWSAATRAWPAAPVLPSDTPPPARRTRATRAADDSVPPVPPVPPAPPLQPARVPQAPPPPPLGNAVPRPPAPPPGTALVVPAVPGVPPAPDSRGVAPAPAVPAVPAAPGRPALPGVAPRAVPGRPAAPGLAPVAVPSAPAAPGAPAAPAAPAAMQFPCGSAQSQSHARSQSMRSDDDGRQQTLRWQSDDCTVTLSVEGKPELADDLSGFTRVDGPIKLTQEARGETRVLQVTAGSGGAPVYAYTLNGASHAFDAAARQWLQQVLAVLVRQGGFFADQRVSALLRRGGPDAVLAEVSLLGGDYTRRQYLGRLIGSAKLTPAQTARVLDVAERQMKGDYERAAVLTAVVSAGLLTDATRAPYIQAASALQGDHEKAQTLLAPVARGTLTPADEQALARATAAMRGSYDQARVLRALAARRNTSPAGLGAVLDASQSIRGDHERAAVLLDLAANHKLEGALRDAYLRAAQSIRAPFERERALRAAQG